MKIKYTTIGKRDDVFKYFRELDEESKSFKRKWIYRGQKCFDDAKDFRKLTTSLERALTTAGHPLGQASMIEMGFLRKFKRQSELFLEHVPDQGNYMEWFALMQHHGAPTRLLDWTYSFFVALYFGLSELSNGQDCELWAVDSGHLVVRVKKLLPAKADRRCAEDDPNAQVYHNFERMFMRKKPKPFVCPMNPYKHNERLTIQQGLFLCPSDVGRPFSENLASHYSSQSELDKHLRVFRIKNDVRCELLQVLYRMNIGQASLFPGLDGFARSIKDLLVFRKVLDMFPADSPYVKKNVW
jgi:hypothetical protein